MNHETDQNHTFQGLFRTFAAGESHIQADVGDLFRPGSDGSTENGHCHGFVPDLCTVIFKPDYFTAATCYTPKHPYDCGTERNAYNGPGAGLPSFVTRNAPSVPGNGNTSGAVPVFASIAPANGNDTVLVTLAWWMD